METTMGMMAAEDLTIGMFAEDFVEQALLEPDVTAADLVARIEQAQDLIHQESQAIAYCVQRLQGHKAVMLGES